MKFHQTASIEPLTSNMKCSSNTRSSGHCNGGFLTVPREQLKNVSKLLDNKLQTEPSIMYCDDAFSDLTVIACFFFFSFSTSSSSEVTLLHQIQNLHSSFKKRVISYKWAWSVHCRQWKQCQPSHTSTFMFLYFLSVLFWISVKHVSASAFPLPFSRKRFSTEGAITQFQSQQ